MANYRVLVGVDYAGKRAEAGTIVSDIPSRSVNWLLEQGIIEKTEGGKPQAAKRERVSEPEGDND